jgi:predicted CDP-diglyceride synthetase/phosphatidate cytidylyltransferase
LTAEFIESHKHPAKRTNKVRITAAVFVITLSAFLLSIFCFGIFIIFLQQRNSLKPFPSAEKNPD